MIIQSPDKRLHEVALPVTQEDDVLAMVNELLREYAGVGLAAPQIGLPKRIIAFKFGEEIQVILNPEVIKRSEKMVSYVERCLSVGNGQVRCVTRRHKIVKVRGFYPDWTPFTLKAHDLTAIVLQHEIDHLDGILISDTVAAKVEREISKAVMKSKED